MDKCTASTHPVVQLWPPADPECVKKHSQLAPDDERQPTKAEGGEERIGGENAYQATTRELELVEQHHVDVGTVLYGRINSLGVSSKLPPPGAPRPHSAYYYY
jgi:hypothetical protein